MYTVIVADDHPIVRQGLRGLINAAPGFKLVGEASDGQESVQLTERLKPNLLLLDLALPRLHGLEVIRQVRQLSPATHVVVLSLHSNTAYVYQALKNGASGYLIKDTEPEELVSALYKVVNGEKYLSPLLSQSLVDMLMGKNNPLENDPYQSLTTREREILQLTVEGFSDTEIGEKLSISPRTVDRHRFNLKQKLGLHTEIELVRYALKRGILPMDD